MDNETKAWKHIQKQAQTALDKYPTTLEEDNAILAQDKTDKKLTYNERTCVILRQGEKHIYHEIIDIGNRLINMFGLSYKEAKKEFEQNMHTKFKHLQEYITGVVLHEI